MGDVALLVRTGNYCEQDKPERIGWNTLMQTFGDTNVRIENAGGEILEGKLVAKRILYGRELNLEYDTHYRLVRDDVESAPLPYGDVRKFAIDKTVRE